jgi:Sec-independent protein translocase protein TatA
MGTILFLLLLFFVIWPLIKVGGVFMNARKQFKQFYNTMSGDGAGQQQRQQQYYQQAQSQAYQKQKKYNSTDGEYVTFEDIEVVETKTEHKDNGHTTRTHTEQQIVDVEWEDL